MKPDARRVRDILAGGAAYPSLRGPRWSRPFRGVVVSTAVAEQVDVRIAAACLLLPPDGAVTGWAAARLLGAPWFDGRIPAGILDVDAVVPRHRSLFSRPGLRVVRCNLPQSEIVVIDGAPTTVPVRTCFELLRHGRLEDAVVGVDAMLASRLVAAPEVREYLNGKHGWRGVGQARRALALSDEHSESPYESRLRFRWIEAGLPPPLVNRDLVGPDGSHLGRVDLLDIEAGLVAEYDGAHHRNAATHGRDVYRQQQLEAHGLTVVRFTVNDLVGDFDRLSARLREARERGLRRDRTRDRWAVVPAGLPWWLHGFETEG